MGKRALNAFWLSPQEIAVLMRPMRGEGGFNTFLRFLQGEIEPCGRIILTDDQVGEVTRIVRYARTPNGNGGAEGRLRTAFRRHLGVKIWGIDQPELDLPDA